MSRMKQVCRTWSGAVKGPGRSILAHPCYVSGLCRLDDRRIVTCGADKLVRLWDVMAERGITPEPSGAFVVGSGGDGSGSGASRRPGTDSAGGLDRGVLLWALPGHTKGVDCCCVVEEGAEASYPYGGHVITGGADGCVIVCSLPTTSSALPSSPDLLAPGTCGSGTWKRANICAASKRTWPRTRMCRSSTHKRGSPRQAVLGTLSTPCRRAAPRPRARYQKPSLFRVRG